MAQVLNRDPTGLALRADPTALAPERLLVFEVRGSVAAFAAAVRRVPGLELIDEEELQGDEIDKAPTAYLMVPDIGALRNIESLWQRWQRDQLLVGETPWRDVFSLLRDLRLWGPADRVQAADTDILHQEIEDRGEDEPIRLEIELVYRASIAIAREREEEVRAAIAARFGRVISRSRIDDIAYHALLVELPVRFVREIIEHSPGGLAGLEPVMHIRPQSLATVIEVADQSEPERAPTDVGDLADPILALLDGVPVGAHRLLERHVVIDDQFGLEAGTPVAERIHGTAMASLIVHGDRNRSESPLPRRIHVVPVLGAGDSFPNDRLIVDIIYTAVIGMRAGDEPSAPEVLIVNISLGNRRRPFHGQLSPWARLLDRLAYRFGILFLVSSGNVVEPFGIPSFPTRIEFEDAEDDARSRGTLRAIGNVMADRRLISPAETVNGLTIGACNDDAVPAIERVRARVNVDPYSNLRISNPSSALGPGFALSVKPDILMPGSREHLRVINNDPYVIAAPARPSRSAGIKVAAPPLNGRENVDGFTGGTSAATALASRTCHQIHDALEAVYSEEFTRLAHLERAVLLKALLAHPAKWPDDTAALVRGTIGPPEGKYHSRQKDNIRRFLGYGIVEADDAVSCAADRATLWATGRLPRDMTATVRVPVPASFGGQARAHSLSATLAWFTPVSPGRKSYRSVRLKIIDPSELDSLAIRAHSNQPDGNQTRRGTLFMRRWSGDRAPIMREGMAIELVIQRDPDQNNTVDEPVPFGLAITLAMPGALEIYDQVRQRLGIRAPV